MRRELPPWKWQEWKIFEELEPFSDERIDWGFAHVCQFLARNGKPLRDFMLPHGDYTTGVTVVQDLKTQELLLDTWIAGSNLMFEKLEKQKNGR